MTVGAITESRPKGEIDNVKREFQFRQGRCT